MPDIRELSADEFDMERMLGIEQEEYGKHVRLWRKERLIYPSRGFPVLCRHCRRPA